jgi:phosphate transport system substrate-binding protein
VKTSLRRSLLGGAIALTLVAAACGSDDDSSDSTEAPTEEATTTAAGAETTAAGAETSAAGGGGEAVSGSVVVSGSSTVEPISVIVGEKFKAANPDAGVTVDGPGTGDGFQLFCNGETDISDASRPISDEEIAACEGNGIEYTELKVGIDGLTVATNPANDAVECLDVPALYALIGPESEGIDNWSGANELATEVGSAYTSLPDADLVISGPGEESGTYDTFVEFAIADLAEERGQDEATRADYNSSPNDNVIVQGIEGSDTSLGWVGFAYYEAEKDRMKALGVDTGDGCVVPTPETIADGSYGFSRPLFIYVNNAKAAENSAVKAFVDLYLSEEGLASVTEAGYVALPDDEWAASQDTWAAVG